MLSLGFNLLLTLCLAVNFCEVCSLTISPDKGSDISGQSFQIIIYDPPNQYQCFVDVNNISPGCVLPTNSSWSISDSASSNRIKILRRSSLPTSDLKETVTVECCDTSGATPSSLAKSTYNIVFSSFPVNFSATTNTSQRSFPSFGYVDIAPCPCDLSPGKCDAGCCCDSDCSGDRVNLTSCATGVYGGNFTQSNSRSCSYSSLTNQEDYHVLMCVFFENNAIIGNLYPLQSALKDSSSFSSKYNSISNKPGLSVAPLTVYPPASTLDQGYKIGEVLHTLRGAFALPTGQNGGSCVDSKIVQFLMDTNTACTLSGVSATFFTGETYHLKKLGSQTATSAEAPVRTCTGVSLDCTGTNIVSVEYRIKASGSVITDYTVTIEMSNSAPPGGTKFSAKFLYASSTTGTPSQRSGLLGYEIGRPLLSGLKQVNSDGSFNSIDTNTTVSLLKPDLNTKCNSNSLSNEILFGRNYLSSCRYEIKLSDLTNCTKIFNELRDFITIPIPNDIVLGLYGDPNKAIESDWVTVNREDLSYVNNTINQTLQISLVLHRVPACINITTGTNLNILYAEQGRARNQPIYQIVGAFLKYTLSNISFSCVSTDPDDNCSSLDSTKSITIANSVTFHKVPSNWKTASRSLFTACWNAVCWEQAFIIFQKEYVPADQRRYHIGMGLFILVLAIFTLGISQPWW